MKRIITTILSLYAGVLFAKGDAASESKKDTLYFNRTYVMTAQGQIMANSELKRMSYYTDKGIEFVEDNVTVMNYPDGEGGTHVNKTEENYKCIAGEIVKYVGKYTENDSITEMKAELYNKHFKIYGKLAGGNMSEWMSVDKDKYDFLIIFLPLSKIDLTKKVNHRKLIDIYDMRMRDVRIEFLGSEKVTVAGEEFDCTMINFDNGAIEGKLWMSKDETGTFFLVKEEAIHRENGPFEMMMTDFSRTNPNKKIDAPKAGEFGF
ncbi:hypothetical protein EMN47_14125 [Prolixibacteraceae bacterium JC049]|nr:hypothetical protein [Prolixibacteraceae bacterium JC049]